MEKQEAKYLPIWIEDQQQINHMEATSSIYDQPKLLTKPFKFTGLKLKMKNLQRRDSINSKSLACLVHMQSTYCKLQTMEPIIKHIQDSKAQEM